MFGSEGRTLIKSLSTQADKRVLTPILGVALTDSLVGSRRSMARSFAAEFEFPLAEHLRDDLPQVAQFVRVKAGSSHCGNDCAVTSTSSSVRPSARA